MKRKYFLVSLLTILLGITSILPTSNISPLKKDNDTSNEVEYIVKEDAYLRNGSNANKNYNYETITKAHGAQYENLNYKVINAKKDPKNEILAVMKFDLPSIQEVEENGLDTYEFQFSIFKNADPNTGDQDYIFHYTTDTQWSETEITWNNRPASIAYDNPNSLFTFHINKGDAYEGKTEEEKTVRCDITNVVESLIKAEEKEITVFVEAKNSMNTSLMMHAKETAGNDKQARIVATSNGIDLNALNTLIEEVKNTNGTEYTTDSFEQFKEMLDAAIDVSKNASDDIYAIRSAYRNLKASYEALVSLEDPNDPDNIAYKKPTRTNLGKGLVANVNDGDVTTSWNGTFFPAYVDIDLMSTYAIDRINLHLPTEKKGYYTIYGSNDGRNYDRIYQ